MSYAFPRPKGAGDEGREGMTLREYYAGQVLIGLLGAEDYRGIAYSTYSEAYIAEKCFKYADVMIQESKKYND